MCGICGSFGDPDVGRNAAMRRKIEHRGPDDEGFHGDGPLAIGIRRLSIIDPAGGHQPVRDETGSIHAVVNGEIYNFRELRQELEAKGHRFRTRSDAEVIPHLYEEHGEEFPALLRGMFAIALLDAKREKLLLVRDRIGIKPLYLHREGGALYFASELKCFLDLPSFRREIDFGALLQYLAFLYVPAPRTIFAGVEKLPPGHMLVKDGSGETVRRWWSVDLSKKIEGSDEELTRETLARLRDAVHSHLVSDVPLGVFLSGGIDSSAIVALAAEASDRPVKTFTVGFGGAASGYDEVEHARKVARAFGTEHHECVLEESVVDILPKVLWHFDEPFGNSTVVLTYLLSRFTREHVTVALSGTGGDEVFFGYPRYVGLQYVDAYRRLPRFLRKGVLEKAVRALPESSAGNDPVRRLAKRTKRFVNGSELDPDARYVSWLTYFDRAEQARLVRDHDAWLRHEKGIDGFLLEALRGGNGRGAAGPGDGLGYPDRAFRADLLTFLPYNQLEYMDKMSMAQSLEARVPFCDHLLVEWSAALRPDLKLSGRGTKMILKKAMKGILPGSIVNRRKVGFDAPVGHWFKRELKDLLVDTLSPARLAETGLLEPAAVNALLAQHLSGRRDLSVHLWILLVLEVWYRLYILEGITEEPGYGLRELLAA